MPERDLQSCFPRWYALSRLPANLWSLPCALRTNENFAPVLVVIDAEQRAAQRVSPASLYQVSAAMVNDVFDLQRTTEDAEMLASLQYLQFEISSLPLHVAIGQGEYSSVYDWIHNAVDDTMSETLERQFETGRIATLVTTDIEWIVLHRKPCFLQWFANFYYYCRNMAALHPIANALLPSLLHVLTPPWPDEGIAVRAIVLAMNWATANHHPRERDLAKLAAACFEYPKLSSELKAWIAIGFLTDSARFTSRTPQEWAQWALKNQKDSLSPNDALQALITVVSTAADWDDRRVAVLEAINAGVAEQRARFPHPTAFVQRLERGIKMLDLLIFKLHAFEKGDALLDVFCHWYGVSPAIRHRGPALFCLPNHGQGTAFIGRHSSLLPFSERDAIDTLNQHTNAALGTAFTLAGQREYEAVRDRPGTPHLVIHNLKASPFHEGF